MSDAAPTSSTAATPSAVYYDGVSSRKRAVTLDFGEELQVRENGELRTSWPYAAIRRADGPRDRMRLSCETAPPLARLEVRDLSAQAALTLRCSALDTGHAGRTGTARIVGWSLAAVASIVLVILYGVPVVAERLTPLIPQSFERRVGDVADNQMKLLFEGKTCDRADGQAAFAKLVGALREAGGLDPSVTSAVITNTTANAIALPGGRIYLFAGLLKKAESPDEIAGVIAHELGHVRHRDHLRALIQNGGTSFLLGLLLGDITGSGAVIFASRTLFNASYSREAENDADRFAIDVMKKLGRSPRPMGELLFRVTGKQGDKSISVLNSHPLTEDRLARMKREDSAATGAPLLNEAEWQALKQICDKPENSDKKSAPGKT